MDGFKVEKLSPSYQAHSTELADQYVLVDDIGDLNIETVEKPPQYPLSLDVHPLPEHDAVLVSVHPPREPIRKTTHVPCDIVLVIDVSVSMNAMAPFPDSQDKEHTESSGLSVLDLVKHAAKTILETLNEKDRLGIVTFSQDAKVVQPLLSMTSNQVMDTTMIVEALRVEGATNLWAGIRTGLRQFENSWTGNTQGLFVLTDGLPNLMCPPQGYVAKLGPILESMADMRPCNPTIHTFGFGYNILSSILQSIAETGSGNYAFIPDAGMIGTVFVHAVANLYSTYTTNAILEIKSSNHGTTFTSKSGIPSFNTGSNRITVKLGNIQYGQSRDTVISVSNLGSKDTIDVTLKCQTPNGTTEVNTAVLQSIVRSSAKVTISRSTMEYHLFRTHLCAFLASLFPFQPNGEHVRSPPLPEDVRARLSKLVKHMRLCVSNSSPVVSSLLADIVGIDNSNPSPNNREAEPNGQVYQALIQTSASPYYKKWGQHYLPSLLHAHLRQTCNSFKDPGPLQYGLKSPLFIRCRDELDAAFDELPAPRPSQTSHSNNTHGVSMGRYNSSTNPCFLGDCLVKLTEDETIKIKHLRAGMEVWCPLTEESRRVVAIIETKTKLHDNSTYQRIEERQTIHRVGKDLWITAYHPILTATAGQTDKTWAFPSNVAAETRTLNPSEAVYSILLSPSKDPNAHTITVNDIVCVTLGHGLTEPGTRDSDLTIKDSDDVRIHPFFGDHKAITESLNQLDKNEKGHFMCGGISRDSETGRACEFLPVGWELNVRSIDCLSTVVDFGSQMLVAASA